MSRFGKQTGRIPEAIRGLINPPLIRSTSPRRYDIRQTLVISGYPRSGTTWLAEIVARAAGGAILFEPLDFRQVPAARRAGSGFDNFRSPDEHWPAGEEYLRRVLSGRVLTRWTTSHIPFRQAIRVRRWIVKFVRANQMLAWLVGHFDVPAPVFLMRHPCAVFSSWVSRGWPLVTHPLPATLRFFSAYPEHLEWVRALRRPEEIFAAQWAMQHCTAFDQLRPDSYYLCVYERMIADGLEETRRVLSHWSLDLPADIEAALDRPSAKASSSLATGGSSQLASWKGKLEPGMIARMVAVLQRFGLDFYGPDPQPDYDRLACRHHARVVPGPRV